MKLFTAEDIRQWDQYTIREEGISSADLMERAATACFDFITTHFSERSYTIVCGVGNNGGDGLVIARLLFQSGREVDVIAIGDREKQSADFIQNLDRLVALNKDLVRWVDSVDDLQLHKKHGLLIDCLFGTGLSRPVEGELASMIDWMNHSGNQIISIDVPSGLNCDLETEQVGSIVKAHYTLTFQIPKRSFLCRENSKYVGTFFLLDIGLSQQFATNRECDRHWTILVDVRKKIQPIDIFQYKNSKGHLQLIAGSTSKMGAAVLAARAAKRSGCGLVTAYVPQSGVNILQIAVPEVMCVPDEGRDNLLSAQIDPSKDALAIGPGMGLAPETALMLRRILAEPVLPMVIDADALTLIADKTLMSKVPQRTIITPHIGEFDRLFGKHENSFLRIKTQVEKAKELQWIIVLKGPYTSIALPDGNLYFNSTGNPGMATAGSGDVLTGVIGSLLAQGYAPEEAAIIGVFLHGLAGDMARDDMGVDGLLASDFIERLPLAWKKIRSKG